MSMLINNVPVDSIQLDPANVRTHSETNIDAIKVSFEKFGQQKPIVVGSDGVVIAGNGALLAARSLGWETVAVTVSGLDGVEATAYAIADNRTAELATWDGEALAKQLEALRDDITIDETVTGYSEPEIAELLAPSAGDVVEDDVPEPPDDPITKRGDLWLLGRHRVLCGDSTDGGDVGRVMDGKKVALCFTSPPYGQQRDYTDASDCSDWDGLMRGVFGCLPMRDDGQVLVNLGLIHRDNEWLPYWEGWIEWMRSEGWRRFGWYVWDQGAGFPGDWRGRLGPSHEWVFHFNKKSLNPSKWIDKKVSSICAKAAGSSIGRNKDGSMHRIDSPEACAQLTKIPDSVLRIPRRGGEWNHPAPFPVALPLFFARCWFGAVYDPFLGSGTTLIAAEQLDRTCYGLEIEPRYVDVIVKRWETLTGETATLEQVTA